jgi:hypothetical protein
MKFAGRDKRNEEIKYNDFKTIIHFYYPETDTRWISFSSELPTSILDQIVDHNEYGNEFIKIIISIKRKEKDGEKYEKSI